MKTNLSFLIVATAFGASYACGGSVATDVGQQPTNNDTTGDDAGTADTAPPTNDDAGTVDATPPPDHGAPSNQYPAFKPDVGQIVNNGGLVLSSPVAIAITWNSDASQAQFESFADGIGATSYWTAAVAEYGTGPLTSGASNHVHISDAAPAQIADQDLQNMVTQNAGKTWPTPTQNSIYAFFLPPGTSLQFGQGGDACSSGIGGYHDQTTVNGQTVAYAVVPSCTFGGGNAFQNSTMSMSHELIEASTDPHPQDNNPGWVGFDPDHLSYEYFQQFSSEDADSCEFFRDSFFEDKESSFDFFVQRNWTNKGAAAGHAPCSPAPQGPYFNVTPLDLQKVNIDLSGFGGSAATPTKGVHIPVGQTGTFQVGFYSDAPTSGPWTLQGLEGNPILGTKTSRLKISVDKTSGVNGEKAYVTVTVNTAGRSKGELMTMVSSMNGVKHYMPILIGSEP